ncbi:hypothetical protein ACFE04_015875 [Oxalis oulophora]
MAGEPSPSTEAGPSATATESIVETLKLKGWCLNNNEQLKTLIMIHSAIADDVNNTRAIADSIESELLNTDLRSIGAKSLLLDSTNPNKPSYFVGPIILQVCSVRDISVSSIESFTKSSSERRLLRLGLTDGHTQMIAIEFTRIPSIPDDIVPGTKIRLENKVALRSGILCLDAKSVTVLGGVVQSLYEEWQMNRKYSGASRSSRLKLDGDNDGPPSFEKFQVGRGSRQLAAAKQGIVLKRFTVLAFLSISCISMWYKNRIEDGYPEATPENSGPIRAEATEKKPSGRFQGVISREDRAVNEPKIASLGKTNEEKPSSSNVRPKEVAEAVPVQNQAAAQKLLQKMNNPNQENRQFRGRKYRGKAKEEEQQVFTLDEWEKRKAGAKPYVKNEIPNTNNDEDLARQLQNQLNMEDSYMTTKWDTEVEDKEEEGVGEEEDQEEGVEEDNIQPASLPLPSFVVHLLLVSDLLLPWSAVNLLEDCSIIVNHMHPTNSILHLHNRSCAFCLFVPCKVEQDSTALVAPYIYTWDSTYQAMLTALDTGKFVAEVTMKSPTTNLESEPDNHGTTNSSDDHIPI